MKFNFSENWYKHAAKIEEEVPVGGLMACNPNVYGLSQKCQYKTDDCRIELKWDPIWYKPWTWLRFTKSIIIEKYDLISFSIVKEK